MSGIEAARQAIESADAELAKAERLVRLATAAIALSVTVPTVRKYCQCGLLECRRLGVRGQWRVLESSIQKLIAGEGDRTNAPK